MKYLLILFLGFNTVCISQNLEAGEGFVQVEGGRIWYKIVGMGNKTPLLLIHGGPGASSCAGIPSYSLLANDRPIIFYDQLGSGRSDRPTDTTLWKLSRFVNEIDTLRKALHLEELHVLGHSWGGTILIEYLLTKKPKGIKSAIFCSPLLSTPLWIKDANALLAQLPKSTRETIQKYEAMNDYTAPAYTTALNAYYAKLSGERQSQPSTSTTCTEVAELNTQVLNYFWGPAEFNATGSLKNFDRTNRLHEVKEPVLFISGDEDLVRPETIYQFQKMVNNSEVVVIDGAGHVTIIDQPILFTDAVRKFMKAIEWK